MLAILFWILVLLVLVIVIPDRWHARREIAKRQAGVRRDSLESLRIQSAERWRRPGRKARRLN